MLGRACVTIEIAPCAVEEVHGRLPLGDHIDPLVIRGQDPRAEWRVEAEAKYVFFQSNESAREREGYRLTLSVGYVF